MAARITGTDTSFTKSTILRAAETLFAEKGFDGTGIDEIARTAGITKSVIYYHFRNKEDIRRSIIVRFIDETMALKEFQVKEAVENPSTLSENITLAVRFLKEKENAVKILMMQTMLEGEANPLLEFWDRNNEIARRFRKILFGEDESVHKKDNFLDAFFLMLVPVFSYFAFADSWCGHYSISRNEADDLFEESLTRLFTSFINPEYGLDALVRNKKEQ